jgi:4-amino-4-deoxy-L-arabinose transferase-like glycosyltransferase
MEKTLDGLIALLKRHGLGCILITFTALVAYMMGARLLIDLSDTLDFINRGYLLFTDRADWVNGIYPFGYPLLLRGIATLVVDYVLAAKIVSALAGILCVWLFYKTALKLFDSVGVTLLLTFFFAFNTAFFRVARLDGTDMVSLAFILLAYYFLSGLAAAHWQSVFYAGLALGCSYLIRYSALAILPLAAVSIAFINQKSIKEKGVLLLSLLAGFIITASPQLVMSFYKTGQLFYNEQYKNIWFGIYGENDWGRHWAEANQKTSLWQVISQDPALFILNMGKNMMKIFGAMFDYPFLFVAGIGVLALSILPEWRKKTLWILLCTLGIGGAISMAFVYYRLALPVFPGIVLLSGIPFAILVGYLKSGKAKASLSPVYIKSLLLVGALLCVVITLDRFAKQEGAILLKPLAPADRARFGAMDVLKNNGYTHAGEVLSFSFDQYDLYDPIHPLFNRQWFYEGYQFKDTTDLRQFVRRVKPTFILTDNGTQWAIPGMSHFWPNTGFERYADRIYSQAGVELWKVR